MNQLDIFGELVDLKPAIESAKQPVVSQPRLFEPQMEGQLDLEPQPITPTDTVAIRG